MKDYYPCTAPAFSSQGDVLVALEKRIALRGEWLSETPYPYICADAGHWHYHLATIRP